MWIHDGNTTNESQEASRPKELDETVWFQIISYSDSTYPTCTALLTYITRGKPALYMTVASQILFLLVSALHCSRVRLLFWDFRPRGFHGKSLFRKQVVSHRQSWRHERNCVAWAIIYNKRARCLCKPQGHVVQLRTRFNTVYYSHISVFVVWLESINVISENTATTTSDLNIV